MNALFLLKSKLTVAYLYDTNTVRQGLEKMRAHGYTAIPVITQEGYYAGTVSEGDFLWHLLDENNNNMKYQERRHIRDLLRPNFNPAVRVTAELDELLQKAVNQNFIPVIDDRDMFIGIITRKDIIQYFIHQQSKHPFL